MKKYILTNLIVFLSTSFLFAQLAPISIPIGKKKINTITCPVDSGKFFMVHMHEEAIGGSTTNGVREFVQIDLYTADLNRLQGSQYIFSSSLSFIGCTQNRTGYALLFKSDLNLVLFIKNFSGKDIKELSFPALHKASLLADNKIFTQPSDSSFYVFYPNKRKSRRIQKISSQGNLLWQKEFITSKYANLSSTIILKGDKLIFDYLPAKSATIRNRMYISTSNGNTITDAAYVDPFDKQKKTQITTAFTKGDTIYTTGVYFHKHSRGHDHDGIFIQATTVTGTKIVENYYPVDQLASIFSQEQLQGKPEKFIPRYLINTGTKFIIAGETLDKVASGAFAAGVASGIALGMLGIPAFISPQVTAFRIQDLVFVETSTEGSLEKATKIKKYLSGKTVPYTGAMETWVTGVFDVDSYIHDTQKHQYIFLLKENPIAEKDQPRIGYVVMGENGTTFELKSHLLSKLIQEEKKIKAIDWFLLSNGDVVLKYQTKDDLHMKKVTADEFN